MIEATTFIFWLVLLFSLMAPTTTGELDPARTSAFLTDNQAIFFLWSLVIYVIFGILLVVLSLAPFEWMREGSPGIIIGLATTLWTAKHLEAITFL